MKLRNLIPLMAIAIFSSKINAFAQTQDGDYSVDFLLVKPHKCPKPNMRIKVSYNSVSTVLNVAFPTNDQGGKIEIYRNGTRVVGVKAPAGTSLCYMLRNYGKGEYIIIVSQGNSVVYSKQVTVK